MVHDFTFEQIQDRPVAVIGGGTLGRRIALLLASRGGTVRIFDQQAPVAESAAQYVTETLLGVIEARGSGEVGTAVAAPTLSDALENAWLVVEAVPERLDIKIPLWGQVDKLAPEDAIFATNSSSYASRLMNEEIQDKTRLCNLHFSMPPISNAAELMSDGETDRELMDTLLRVLPEFDVHPFEVRKESTGFIFNRVWAAIKRESLAVVADGVSTPEDVDAIFRVNWHTPVGPFQMMDEIGLDVVLDIEEHYAQENPQLPEGPRKLLRGYVDAGKLGRKSGEGFYSYAS